MGKMRDNSTVYFFFGKKYAGINSAFAEDEFIKHCGIHSVAEPLECNSSLLNLTPRSDVISLRGNKWFSVFWGSPTQCQKMGPCTPNRLKMGHS